MQKKSIYMHYFIIYMFLLVLFSACSNAKSEKKSEKINRDSTATTEITTVNAIIIEKKLFSYEIKANGKIEAQTHAELRFKNGGYLAQVLVSNGQFVGAGQAVAILETADQTLALRKAQNQKNINYEEYIKEVTDFGGNPTLPNGGIDPLLHERIRTRKNLTTADLQIEEANLNIGYTTLRSPVGGVVADLILKRGNFISPTQTACIVYSPQTLELTLDVLETELALLQKGQKAEIKAIGKAGKVYQAFVADINPRVNNSGMVKVKLAIQNAEGLFVGMNASATIFVPQKETLIIPREAIVIRSGKKVVFTEEKNLAKWHYIVTGLENNKEVEVTEGLVVGEKVITTNNLQLAHDSPIIAPNQAKNSQNELKEENKPKNK